MKSRQKGFTLIELLIVVAIIGIIAALLIPNFLDSIQKSKQKRTQADMVNLGTVMMSWLTDQAGAAAAAGAATSVDLSDYVTQDLSTLEGVLLPDYVQEVPERDGWKNLFDFYLDIDDPNSEEVIGIRSRGRDNIATGSTYDSGPFNPTDYDQDLVWVDGYFVRWPQRQPGT